MRCYSRDMKHVFPTHLSNRALELELIRLARCERQATVQLMTHLAELDRRRLYRDAGYSSLFVYCTRVLQLSEHEAFNRMKAARAIRRFPQILELLAHGSLNLTTVRLIAGHMTPDNQERVLKAACGKSKRQVEELVARLAPRPDVPATIRALPSLPAGSAAPIAPAITCPQSPLPVADALPGTMAVTTPVAAPTGAPPAAPPPAARHRPAITPLSPDRYQITFTATAETREKLEFARDLLRHALPTGDIAAIVNRALTVLIEDLVKKRFAVTNHPRKAGATAKGSRHIPATVNRAVYIRDRGRCTFVSQSGHRCNERGFAERHHGEPHAVGGAATVDNVRLLCRAHNAYEAEKYFGRRWPEGEVKEAAASYGRPNVNFTRPGTTCALETQPSS